MPYLFSWMTRLGLKNFKAVNQQPRRYLADTTGWIARANAVQQNSFEGLPLFLVAVMMAEYLVVMRWAIVVLGSAYIVFRLAYGICYLANWASLRSIFWLLATSCPVILLYLCMDAYRFAGM